MIPDAFQGLLKVICDVRLSFIEVSGEKKNSPSGSNRKGKDPEKKKKKKKNTLLLSPRSKSKGLLAHCDTESSELPGKMGRFLG